MDASIEKALNSLGDAVKESLGREGQILSAVDAFRVLLRQQLERIDHMNTDKVDFSTNDAVTIGLIDGDGIGAVITSSPCSPTTTSTWRSSTTTTSRHGRSAATSS